MMSTRYILLLTILIGRAPQDVSPSRRLAFSTETRKAIPAVAADLTRPRSAASADGSTGARPG